MRNKSVGIFTSLKKTKNLLHTIRPQQVLLFGSLIRWQPTFTAGQFSWHTILALKQIHMLQALGSVSNSPCLYFLPLDKHHTDNYLKKNNKVFIILKLLLCYITFKINYLILIRFS